MGKFITFEGGEGAGKSTQVTILAQRLETEFGLKVVVTREPGGSPFTEKIRDLILSKRPAVCETEFLLFAASRTEHIATVITPALKAGYFVICDRFIDSTRVYQGVLGDVSPEFIKTVEQFTVRPYIPELTLILDVPAELSISRARTRGALSRYDAIAKEQHQVLRNGFLEIAMHEPRRCVVIDGARSEEKVGAEVFETVVSRLQLRS